MRRVKVELKDQDSVVEKTTKGARSYRKPGVQIYGNLAEITATRARTVGHREPDSPTATPPNNRT